MFLLSLSGILHFELVFKESHFSDLWLRSVTTVPKQFRRTALSSGWRDTRIYERSLDISIRYIYD